MAEVGAEQKASAKPMKKKAGFRAASLIIKAGIKTIIVLALIGGAYFLWQQQASIDELLSVQNQFIVENEGLLRQIQDLQQDFDVIDNTEASSELLFNQQNVRLDNLNEELVSLRLGVNANQSNGVWQIVEATSLLRLAQQYLELVQDVPVALNLYQASNAILAHIDDPALDRIKNLLVSDIQILRNSRGIDTEGFYMRLNDISQQLDSINLATFVEPSSAFMGGRVDNETTSIFSNFASFVAQYFTVRKLDAPIAKPLNDQQISFLRQNMQLQIEQAKLALLQRRQAIYQDSISSVIMLAQQNIPEQEQQKTYILGVLSDLQDETILLDLPRISGSLSLLENLVGEISEGPIN